MRTGCGELCGIHRDNGIAETKEIRMSVRRVYSVMHREIEVRCRVQRQSGGEVSTSREAEQANPLWVDAEVAGARAN